MDSKQYLNVKTGSKSALIDLKQKSFESFDSTSSNYSQISDYSDLQSPSQRLETLQKLPSPNQIQDQKTLFKNKIYESCSQLSHATSEPSNGSYQAQIKRTFWQKTVSSFRSYKHKGVNLKRHKSATCQSNSSDSFDTEIEEIDPVYHLLRCAATQGKSNKGVCAETSCPTNNSFSERPRSLSGSQFHSSRGDCTDPKCPCKYPEKIPVVKREDIGQQAKRNLTPKTHNFERKQPFSKY